MSLLELVARRLTSEGFAFATIGAAALAHHGVSRATQDVDLLCVDASVLDGATWDPLRGAGIEVRISHGDVDDPLAGVVRFRQDAQRPVDLIVGKRGWNRSVIERAAPGEVAGISVPVASAPDLILLKLYAGGPQDAWDIAELLSGDNRAKLVAEVENNVRRLPAHARELWARILE